MHILRFSAAAAILASLSACAPPLPDSNPQAKGVGFGDYSTYQRYTAPQPEVRTTTPPPAPTPESASPPVTAGGTPLVAPGIDVAGVDTSRISDEQNFDAVSSRETIESDAARLKAQRDTFTEVAPEPVPTRSGDDANVVAYALSTNHPVGQKVYNRGGLISDKRYQRSCAAFASTDLAQEAFLKAGGPQKDRLKIDPDGDGFACGWNPAKYRRFAG